MFRREFPRKPDQEELEVLFRILPENKSGYRNYRKIISESYLTGTGSSDESLVLSRNPKADYSQYITPVFAAGTFLYKNNVLDVIIHEEIDETIEIEINITDKKIDGFIDTIYPEWIPGQGAPGDNTPVREIILSERYTLVITHIHKRIWLYDNNNGVNSFITPGAYYSSLCMIRNIRDPEIVLNPKLLFENLDNYHDNELISAFYLYNNNLKKFRIDMPVPKQPEKKTGFLKSFLKKEKD
jgi:hypothetical protein